MPQEHEAPRGYVGFLWATRALNPNPKPETLSPLLCEALLNKAAAGASPEMEKQRPLRLAVSGGKKAKPLVLSRG